MNESGALFLGLNAIVAALVGVLAFAVARFIAAARSAGKERAEGTETAFMAAAMEQAVKRLKEEGQAMQLRAEASERLSEQIIASLTSGLLVVGSGREVRTMNPAARRMLHLGETDANRPVRDVLSSVPTLAVVIEECLASGRPILRRKVQVGLADGSAVHLGVTVSPIREGEGPAEGAICLFTDLSAVVELEEQLRLKDSLAQLGELTAGIAHEFRNGLATIHGYGRLLELERLPEDYRPYVAGIRDETEALRQVVINFLNFAKPDELALTAVSLRSIADRAAEEIRTEVTSRGGSVTVAGEFGSILGDEVLLRQAFSNLCRNALEASLETATPPRVRIEGSIDAAQRQQQVAVIDSGPGVDAAVTARMFRPFFTTQKTGTGLGLSLVQKIVVTHNGRVSASNAPEGGARISVVLPLDSDRVR
jgi:two-component system sensor histidine kinase PilS (NtrC family)